MKLFLNFLKNTEGSTAIEYGLIVLLISILLVGWASYVGESLGGTFNTVSNSINVAR